LDSIKKILKIVDDFPTLPTIYTALSDVITDPRSTSNDAANIVSKDQSSVSKILRVANSPIYGFLGRIDSISQAIFFIGFEEVKNLVLALSIFDMFKDTKIVKNLNPVDFWKHSIAVGVITRLIGSNTGVKNLENYFISGIMHDIGKLLFMRYLEDDFIKALDYAQTNNITIREAESHIFGITHTVAGELIAEKWGLPRSIKNAIRYHSTGYINGSVDTLVGTVHIADIVSRMMSLGDPGDHLIPEPSLEVWNKLCLDDNIFTKLHNKIINDYDESIAMFLLD
jgi:HD-like signal output (HDOD) protein